MCGVVRAMQKSSTFSESKRNSTEGCGWEVQCCDLDSFCFIPCVGPLFNESAPFIMANIASNNNPNFGLRIVDAMSIPTHTMCKQWSKEE